MSNQSSIWPTSSVGLASVANRSVISLPETPEYTGTELKTIL